MLPESPLLPQQPPNWAPSSRLPSFQFLLLCGASALLKNRSRTMDFSSKTPGLPISHRLKDKPSLAHMEMCLFSTWPRPIHPADRSFKCSFLKDACCDFLHFYQFPIFLQRHMSQFEMICSFMSFMCVFVKYSLPFLTGKTKIHKGSHTTDVFNSHTWSLA